MENGRIFQQLIPEIIKIYGDSLVSIILYGSVARGTQTDESDIDIAVMLRSEENSDMKERMTDIVVDLELEYNSPFTYHVWQKMNDFIVKECDVWRKEGRDALYADKTVYRTR